MSLLAEDARVQVLLADYIGIDSIGKINALGAGFAMTSVQNGLSAPQHLVVMIDLPQKYAGEDFALTIELRDVKQDRPVQVAGPSGQLEPLRVQQVVRGERPVIPGVYVPDTVPVRVQVAMGFHQGLPLAPGGVYLWRVEIDGTTSWDTIFHVIGPPPGPVFGGPAGPADINVPPPPPD